MDQKVRLAGNWSEAEVQHHLSEACSSLQGPASQIGVVLLLLALYNGPAFTATAARKQL